MCAQSVQTGGASADHQEVEWQFDAGDLALVEQWLLARPSRAGATAGPPVRAAVGADGATPRVPAIDVRPESTIALVDTYFDTADWRLHAAGYSCRIRRTDTRTEATLKSLDGAVDGLRRRRELSAPLDGDTPAAVAGASEPVGNHLRALAGPRPLLSLFTLRTTRRVFALSVDGTRAGEVVLDETVFVAGTGEEAARLSRIEIEAEARHEPAVATFVEEFRADRELRPATSSKYEAGLTAFHLTPAMRPDFPVAPLDPSCSTGEVAFAILRRNFTAFLAHEPGTRLGEDVEELHDMRVAARRMRAVLGLFEDALPVRARPARRELGWIARFLGEVRDQDVQIARLRRGIAGAEPAEASALQELIAVRDQQRDAARKRMLRALDSRRYDRMVAAFTAVLRQGPLRRSAASGAPAVTVAPDLIRGRHRRFRKAAAALTTASPPEDYHRLRILGKRLRYAVEAFAEIYGKPARTFGRRMGDVQDVLGNHQDAHVSITQLRDLSETAPRLAPSTLFVMGRLAQRHAQEADALRREFPRVYKRATGKPWRRLRRAMRALEAAHPSRSGGVRVPRDTASGMPGAIDERTTR